MKQTLLCALAWAAAMPLAAQTYTDPTATPQQRAESIVKEMTLDEKASIMLYESPAIPRLGIKQYNWWNEALHGVARAGTATVFPQPIGMAASFDDRLVYDVFTATSDEARAKNQHAKAQGPLKIYQGLTFWTPNINIFRDPRWGRGHETYGEDPYLTTRMGLSVVRGLQGDTYEGGLYNSPNAPKYYKLHACAKHFAVHSGPEWSRHTFDANDISPRDLWETYMPAFRSLATEGGVKEVMCAYNRLDGEPCCGNSRLLNSILREEWGYKGIVVTDCWAISDFYHKNAHRTSPDVQHAAATAVRAGTDLECGPALATLPEGVKLGLIKEEEIDRSAIRVMKARYELGEMDADSLVSWTRIPYSILASPEHAALAEKMAKESIVLLKNNRILPLRDGMKVGLIGPNANDSIMQWGNYNGFPLHTSTLYTALRERLPADKLVYVPGIDHTAKTMIESLFAQTRSSNGQPGFDATFWNNPADRDKTAGISHRYTSPLQLTTAGATVWAPGVNLGGFYGEFTTKFTPTVSEEIAFSMQTQGHVDIDVNGQRVFGGGNMKSSRAYVMNVEAGQTYDIKVSYSATEGDCASLTFDFGRQAPINFDEIKKRLADVDVIVFAGGLSPQLEGEEMPVKVKGFRGGDRDLIELPDVQQEVMASLATMGKPMVYVNYSGSAVALTDEAVPAQAIVQAWYPGQAGGQAVADVLYGDYNPAGRLPVTFYSATTELPDFEDYNMAGRTYRYYRGKALYPFGHGLSYTAFRYGHATTWRDGDDLIVSIPLTNVGRRDGEEVVQLYMSRPDDTGGPTMQLRAFSRVSLAAGEQRTVELRLSPSQFDWFDTENSYMHPLKGTYRLLYGPSSDIEKLQLVEVEWPLK